MQHPLHTPVAVQDIVSLPPPQRLQAKQGWPLEMGGGGSCLTRLAGGHIIWRSKGLSVKYFTAHHPPSCPHRTHRSRNRPDWRSPWCRAPFSPSLSSEVQQCASEPLMRSRAAHLLASSCSAQIDRQNFRLDFSPPFASHLAAKSSKLREKPMIIFRVFLSIIQ